MNDPFELLCGNGFGIDEKLRVGVHDKLAEDGILLDSRDFRKRGLHAFLFDLRLQGGGAGIVRRIEEQRGRDAPRQMDGLAAAFDGAPSAMAAASAQPPIPRKDLLLMSLICRPP